ncbi:hypothetical protein ACQKWADRAFT_284579 [Trichoderma austrokoningii]
METRDDQHQTRRSYPAITVIFMSPPVQARREKRHCVHAVSYLSMQARSWSA